jgi:hypothetical protein
MEYVSNLLNNYLRHEVVDDVKTLLSDHCHENVFAFCDGIREHMQQRSLSAGGKRKTCRDELHKF